MAKDFIDLIGESVLAINILRRPAFLYEDFFKKLRKEDIVNLLKYDAGIAMDSGAFESRKEYLLSAYGIRYLIEANSDHLGDLLSKMLYLHAYDGGHQDGLHYILKRLKRSLDNPKFCAHALSRQSFIEASVASLIRETKGLRQELRWYERSSEWDSYDNRLLNEFDFLTSSEFLQDSWAEYEHFLDLCEVKSRHPLYQTEYTLILPQQVRGIIFDPIDHLILESTKNQSLLYRLPPRQFEQFIARLFEGFGFDVQLTLTTRDGGVDIVCMTSKYGIPFKLAIEVKRYKPSKPITVELIRSFVGANELVRANKLVYVTTSHYTKDAIKYATSPTLINLLELKQLPDIIEWANEYKHLRMQDIIEM